MSAQPMAREQTADTPFWRLWEAVIGTYLMVYVFATLGLRGHVERSDGFLWNPVTALFLVILFAQWRGWGKSAKFRNTTGGVAALLAIVLAVLNAVIN